jgi:RHS repeat-associated protein
VTRRLAGLFALLLALAGALTPAPAAASLSSAIDELALPALPEQALPDSTPTPSPFRYLETRVGGLDPKPHCFIGGADGLTCGTRREYGIAYDGTALDRRFFAKARWYDPETARFTTQDSYLGQPDDPPSLHRYFYANANPTRYIDLTGHRACIGNECQLDPVGANYRDATMTPEEKRIEQEADRQVREEHASAVWNWGIGWGKTGAGAVLAGAQLQTEVMTCAPCALYSHGKSSWEAGTQFGDKIERWWNSPPGTLMDEIAKDPAKAQQTIGAITFHTQGVAAAGHGAVSWVRGLISKAPVPSMVAEDGIAPAESALPSTRSLEPALKTGAAEPVPVARTIPYLDEVLAVAKQLEKQWTEQGAALEASGDVLAMAKAKSGSPPHLRAGMRWEEAEIARQGMTKNTEVFRPSAEDINSSTFKDLVGEAKYTKGGQPRGTIVDVAQPAKNVEIKGGSSPLRDTYQLRLQVYEALKQGKDYMIQTTRPVVQEFAQWLQSWGASVEPPPPSKP